VGKTCSASKVAKQEAQGVVGEEVREMRKRKAFLVASVVLLVLGMAAWVCGPEGELADCQATATKAAEEAVATVNWLDARLESCEATVTACCGDGPTETAKGGSIEACVRYNDQYTGNARVSATDHEGRAFVAQANGCYDLRDLPPGDYLVKAEYRGVSQSMDVTVHEGGWIHLDFWLEGPPPPDEVISCEEAKNYYGEFKTVQGVFYCSYRPDIGGAPTFCNCPRHYDQHDFTAVIWGDERPIFISCLGGEPATLLDKQEFGVNGLIEEYRGKPQIILTACGQLTVVE